MTKHGYVYILANVAYGTFYIGVTSDLLRRMYEHKHGLVDGFTKKYGLKTLVYLETYSSIEDAIARENSSNAGIVIGKSISSTNIILNGRI